MSEDRKKAEKFLELFNKGKFSEELVRENHRVCYRMARLEAGAGLRSSDEIHRLRVEMTELADENGRFQEWFRKVEQENKDFANRYVDVEEQNNNLANLYLVSCQLHWKRDFREVILETDRPELPERSQWRWQKRRDHLPPCAGRPSSGFSRVHSIVHGA